MHVELGLLWRVVVLSTLSYVDTYLSIYFTSHLKHLVYDDSLGCVVIEMFISGQSWNMFLKNLVLPCLDKACRYMQTGWERKGCSSLFLESLHKQLVQLQSLCIVTLTAYFLWMRCCTFISVQLSHVALDRFCGTTV